MKVHSKLAAVRPCLQIIPPPPKKMPLKENIYQQEHLCHSVKGEREETLILTTIVEKANLIHAKQL